MGLSKKVTGYDRFMDKFNRKKRQTDNVQVKKTSSNKPAANASNSSPAK